MRLLALVFAVLTLLVAPLDGTGTCDARVDTIGASSLRWIPGPDKDHDALARWCRGVGPPLYLPQPSPPQDGVPDLHDLVVVTWNTHMHEGRLADLVAALRQGELTGTPVEHFVLLVQELYRRGPDVPAFAPGVRSAHGIFAEDDEAPATESAATLGLSMLYVPSMRNGADRREDRGNAILSTEPLSNAYAIELPLARQRRVAVGASIKVMRDGVESTLRVLNVHLEPLSAPASWWVFRNPRTRQINSILSLLTSSSFDFDVTWAGTVVGGDFNTVKAGVDEPAYRDMRAWAGQSMGEEDRRATHRLGRLDYLFYQLPAHWQGSTRRFDRKFGSDHHPIVGRFTS